MIQCSCCGQDLTVGQSRLTRMEMRRLPMGNQHTKWNLIRWQVVKGYAEHFGVRDWTSRVDPELTMEENCRLMARDEHMTTREMGMYA